VAELRTWDVCDYLNLSLFFPDLPPTSQPVHDILQLPSLMHIFVTFVAAVVSSTVLEKVQLRLFRKSSTVTDSCPFPVTLYVTSATCRTMKYKRHILW
jgi:hypothetical protein